MHADPSDGTLATNPLGQGPAAQIGSASAAGTMNRFV
jgi:hypothetical protein